MWVRPRDIPQNEHAGQKGVIHTLTLALIHNTGISPGPTASLVGNFYSYIDKKENAIIFFFEKVDPYRQHIGTYYL